MKASMIAPTAESVVSTGFTDALLRMALQGN